MRSLLVAVALAGVCTGCVFGDGDRDRREAREKWNRLEPAAYSFTYRVGGQAGVARMSVTVENGRVTAHRPLGELPYPVEPVTVDGIFAMLAEDQAEADAVEVDYDANWGFPTAVAVDEEKNAIDDEFGYRIGDFRVLSH